MKKKIRKQKIASIIVLSLTLILSGCNKQSTEKTDEDLPNAQAQIKPFSKTAPSPIISALVLERVIKQESSSHVSIRSSFS